MPNLAVSRNPFFRVLTIASYEATKAIRSLDDRHDGRTIPIIAMTANAFAEDVQSSLDAGMNGHLSKIASLRCLVAETVRLRKERYPERDTPKNFSIPEVETRCPVTLDASTFAETSV